MESAVPSANPEISLSKPAITSEEPLRAELKSFLDAVRNRTAPLVSLDEGRHALSLALQIVAAIEQHGKNIQLEKLAAT
jgi:predicted dehydrogenase